MACCPVAAVVPDQVDLDEPGSRVVPHGPGTHRDLALEQRPRLGANTPPELVFGSPTGQRHTSTPDLPRTPHNHQVGTPHARIFNEATNHPFERISDESTRSVDCDIIECMFDYRPLSSDAGVLVGRMCAAVRAENRAV